MTTLVTVPTPDTLPTLSPEGDQRRFLAQRPQLTQAILMLAEINRRSFSTQGRETAIRLLWALRNGSSDLAPGPLAPLYQRVLYGQIRQALFATTFDQLATPGMGTDEPLLTPLASVALARIEAQDPLVATPTGRAADLGLILTGISWRDQ